MILTNTVFLVIYAVLLSAGQVLFKYVSKSLEKNASGPLEVVTKLLGTPTFWLAIVLYGVLAMLWIWILSRVSLVAAYPFAALCFVLVPIMSHFAFGERVGTNYVIGAALLLIGLGFIFSEVSQ